jgi:hypothetical protein
VSVIEVERVKLSREAADAWRRGTTNRRSLLASETAKDLTGLTTAQMAWRVWVNGWNGRISVSVVRRYLAPNFNY